MILYVSKYELPEWQITSKYVEIVKIAWCQSEQLHMWHSKEILQVNSCLQIHCKSQTHGIQLCDSVFTTFSCTFMFCIHIKNMDNKLGDIYVVHSDLRICAALKNTRFFHVFGVKFVFFVFFVKKVLCNFLVQTL